MSLTPRSYKCAVEDCGQPVTKKPTGSGEAKGTKAGLSGWRCAVHGPTKVKVALHANV